MRVGGFCRVAAADKVVVACGSTRARPEVGSDTASPSRVHAAACLPSRRLPRTCPGQRVLGVGGHGKVMHGLCDTGAAVAVKVLPRDTRSNVEHHVVSGQRRMHVARGI